MSIATLHHATYLAEILNHLALRDSPEKELNTKKTSSNELPPPDKNSIYKKRA